MDLKPVYPPFGAKDVQENEIIEFLYKIFREDLIDSKPTWNKKPLKMRWDAPINGRHAIFHHIISDSSDLGKYAKESDRPISIERCARLHWIAPLIEEANSCFPQSENNRIRWWKSERKGSSGQRYVISTVDYDYRIVIDERDDYAHLVTAYYIEQAHSRTKLQKEHDKFWLRRRPI